jgi:hypothetical protein
MIPFSGENTWCPSDLVLSLRACCDGTIRCGCIKRNKFGADPTSKMKQEVTPGILFTVIYGLFNDFIHSSGYSASHGRMISELQ